MTVIKIISAMFIMVLTLGATAPSALAGAASSNRSSVEEMLVETTNRVKRLPERRRSGATKAINLIQTTSEDLSRLVGLEFNPMGDLMDSVQISIAEDGEDLSEDTGDESSVLIGDDGEDLAEYDAETIAGEEEVDLESFRSLWLDFVDEGANVISDVGVEKQHLVHVVMDWLGTNYRFGGITRRGIDCSAFTRMVYRETAGIELPRTANMQANVGKSLDKIEQLQFGDLVLFHTRRYARVTHIGVYLGDNLFAHASSRYGVTISSLESGYYNQRFVGGVHLTQREVVQLAIETPASVEVDS